MYDHVCLCVYLCVIVICVAFSLGLAGVRTTDNAPEFDSKKPLVVVYYDINFELNPKGSNYWRNRYVCVGG